MWPQAKALSVGRASVEGYKRRRQNDAYRDLNILGATKDDIVFFGGKDYLRLFRKLTSAASGRRIVFYNSGTTPVAPGCELRRFRSSNLRKWHYECATAFVDGSLGAV